MTYRELYGKLVGGGMVTPDYFFRRLTMGEAEDLLKFQNEKFQEGARIGYEIERFGAGITYKVMTGENLEAQFPWEREEEVAMPSDEEIEELRDTLRRMNGVAPSNSPSEGEDLGQHDAFGRAERGNEASAVLSDSSPGRTLATRGLNEPLAVLGEAAAVEWERGCARSE